MIQYMTLFEVGILSEEHARYHVSANQRPLERRGDDDIVSVQYSADVLGFEKVALYLMERSFSAHVDTHAPISLYELSFTRESSENITDSQRKLLEGIVRNHNCIANMREGLRCISSP